MTALERARQALTDLDGKTEIEVGDAVRTSNGHVKRVTAVQHPYVTCAWGSGNKSMTGKFHIDELTIYRKAKT